jgi:hypothetical protein
MDVARKRFGKGSSEKTGGLGFFLNPGSLLLRSGFESRDLDLPTLVFSFDVIADLNFRAPFVEDL